ncbi:MAG: hypothetical protein HYX79_10030 [Chloroflexi bacterium]|nr:hypothetical protein [Chloroflexota bacterium]
MKIWCQAMTPYGYDPALDSFGEIVERNCRRVLRADTELHIEGVPVAMKGTEKYASIQALHQLQALNNMLKAENEGYDAFAIICSHDPFLREGREMLSIPVVGITETSFHVASMLGDRFATIPTSYVLSEKYRRMSRSYGVQDRYLSGPYTLGATEEEIIRAIKDPAPIVERFKNEARKAIADGASVLVPLPGFVSICLYRSGVTSLDGVLVMDPIAVTVKMAETMVDLKAANVGPSRRIGAFGSPPKELRTEAFKRYVSALKLP